MNVLVTGSLSFDYIMDFRGRFAERIMPDKIHKISLSFLADKLNKQYGGTAGNIAYTLKLLGVEPQILACVGNDFSPYKSFLRKNNISTKSIKAVDDLATSAYFVITDSDDNQIGSFYVGAMIYAKDLSLRFIKAKVSKDRFVLITPNHPLAMKKYVKECQQFKYPYLYDPAFQIATFNSMELKEGIGGARILIGNDYEIALIENKLEISHQELLAMVPVVITTLGSKGSIIEASGESIHIKPAQPKSVSDPTGAGDAYRAGFMAGYLRDFDLQVCGQMGSVAAVYTVEKYGTVTHHFTKSQFIQRYKDNFGSTLVL